MKKIYQRLWNILLVLLLLSAGIYIFFLRDECGILKDKCHIQSSELTGHTYRGILEWFKVEKGRYPTSLEELIPDYLSSLYDWKLGYSNDPYYWQAIRRLRKENNENPASLETWVPRYQPERPALEYSCNPKGLDYELNLTSETSSFEFSVTVTPTSVYWTTMASLSYNEWL